MADSCCANGSSVDRWNRNDSIDVLSDSVGLGSAIVSKHLKPVSDRAALSHGCGGLLTLHFCHTEDLSGAFPLISALIMRIAHDLTVSLSLPVGWASRLGFLIVIE